MQISPKSCLCCVFSPVRSAGPAESRLAFVVC